MPSGIDVFQADLRKNVTELTFAELIKYQTRYTLDFLRRVVPKTPKDSGHLRFNWQVTLHAPAGRLKPGTGEAPDLVAAEVVLAGLKPFDVVYVSNPEDYAPVWDEGTFIPPDPGPSKDPRPGRKGRILVRGGYSTQAPNGMVGPTLAELREIYGT